MRAASFFWDFSKAIRRLCEFFLDLLLRFGGRREETCELVVRGERSEIEIEISSSC